MERKRTTLIITLSYLANFVWISQWYIEISESSFSYSLEHFLVFSCSRSNSFFFLAASTFMHVWLSSPFIAHFFFLFCADSSPSLCSVCRRVYPAECRNWRNWIVNRENQRNLQQINASFCLERDYSRLLFFCFFMDVCSLYILYTLELIRTMSKDKQTTARHKL